MMVVEIVKKVMELKGDNPNQLSKRLGVPSCQIYNWLNGRTTVTIPLFERISEEYDLKIVYSPE